MVQFGNSAEPRFVAVTADVVGSREVADRRDLQRRLLTVAVAASERLGRSLVADVQVTAGDELQALLRDPRAAVELLQVLSDGLLPAQLTFGLGVGGLSTTLPRQRAQRRLPLLDGPCFHRAREALQAARALDSWAAGRGFGPWQAPLDALLELCGHLRRGWTDKQALYAAAARELTQKDVAHRFKVNPSVVSESLKGAHFALLRRGEAGLEALLQHFAATAESPANSAR